MGTVQGPVCHSKVLNRATLDVCGAREIVCDSDTLCSNEARKFDCHEHFFCPWLEPDILAAYACPRASLPSADRPSGSTGDGFAGVVLAIIRAAN